MTNDVPFKRGSAPCTRPVSTLTPSVSIYIYSPNQALPIFFASSAAVHIFRIRYIDLFLLFEPRKADPHRKYKCWKITGPLSWGAILYIAGFVMREISARNARNLGHLHGSRGIAICRSVGAPSTLLLLENRRRKSPKIWNILLIFDKRTKPVYAHTHYTLLGHTLYYVPYLSIIHPGRIISTFVGLDALLEALTGNGAAKLRMRRARRHRLPLEMR